MERVTIRLRGRLTLVYASRWRSAEHGAMSTVALAGMLLGEMVRTELAAGGSPPKASIETMPA